MRWRSSGLSVAEFAAREGVSAQRLHRWRQRLGVGPVAAAPVKSVVVAPVSFVRVAPPTTAARSGAEPSSAPLPTLRVEHEGVTVTVREDIGAATLATVVHALREGALRC